MSTVVDNFVEVTLTDPGYFLTVRETLTRIGIAIKKTKTLYQSCHILHKRGKFYIVHFKELFLLDGKESTLSSEDIARRNTIVSLLEEWDLVKVVNKAKIEEPKASMSLIKVIPFKEKNEWTLVEKYRIGRIKKNV